MSLGVDKQYDNGWFVSFEGLIHQKPVRPILPKPKRKSTCWIFSKELTAVRYYNRKDEVDDTYGRIMLGSNTNKGHAWNVALTASKRFGNLVV